MRAACSACLLHVGVPPGCSSAPPTLPCHRACTQSAEESSLLSGPLKHAELLQLHATLPQLELSITGRPTRAALHMAELQGAGTDPQQADASQAAGGPAAAGEGQGVGGAGPGPQAMGRTGRQQLCVAQACGVGGEGACLEEEVPIILAQWVHPWRACVAGTACLLLHQEGPVVPPSVVHGACRPAPCTRLLPRAGAWQCTQVSHGYAGRGIQQRAHAAGGWHARAGGVNPFWHARRARCTGPGACT